MIPQLQDVSSKSYESGIADNQRKSSSSERSLSPQKRHPHQTRQHTQEEPKHPRLHQNQMKPSTTENIDKNMNFVNVDIPDLFSRIGER